MGRSTRITVTLPTEQVEQIRQGTDNISGFLAEAVSDRLRHQALGQYLTEYQAENGEFTEAELLTADERLAFPYAPDERLAA